MWRLRKSAEPASMQARLAALDHPLQQPAFAVPYEEKTI
jgi:hypothetical protein